MPPTVFWEQRVGQLLLTRTPNILDDFPFKGPTRVANECNANPLHSLNFTIHGLASKTMRRISHREKALISTWLDSAGRHVAFICSVPSWINRNTQMYLAILQYSKHAYLFRLKRVAYWKLELSIFVFNFYLSSIYFLHACTFQFTWQKSYCRKTCPQNSTFAIILICYILKCAWTIPWFILI